MHDNAIHDLALVYWSELLSPSIAPAIKTNLAIWVSNLSITGLGRKIERRKMINRLGGEVIVLASIVIAH